MIILSGSDEKKTTVLRFLLIKWRSDAFLRKEKRSYRVCAEIREASQQVGTGDQSEERLNVRDRPRGQSEGRSPKPDSL